MMLKNVLGALQAYLIALDEPQGTTDAEELSIDTDVQPNGAIEHTIKIVVRVTPPAPPVDGIPPYLRKAS